MKSFKLLATLGVLAALSLKLYVDPNHPITKVTGLLS